MRIPVIRAVFDRRILVNYRVDPAVLARLLPAPFRPKLVAGQGMAGICLIRLKNARPKFVPLAFGMASENAAHRIAVEWEQAGRRFEGVYIPRRDTSSRFSSFAGGRLFPGVLHHAHFRVREWGGNFQVAVDSDDNAVHVTVAARTTDRLPNASVFESLDAAMAFFEAGGIGYSATSNAHWHDGMELHCKDWQATALEVQAIKSSFFDDRNKFPAGSIVFDSALLMRNIQHEWHCLDGLCCQNNRRLNGT
jgi:hypothetical protein